MIDMSKHIIRKTDQMNAEDLLGGPRTITIRDIKETSSNEQPISLYFEGDNNKPYKPNLSMRKILLACWGKDGRAYVGRSMTLFNDPTVKWAGQAVGGLRISHLSDINGPKTIPITVTRGVKKGFKVAVLNVQSNNQGPQYEAEIEELEAATQRGTDVLRTTLERIKSADINAFRHVKQLHLDRLLSDARKADQALIDGMGPDSTGEDLTDKANNDDLDDIFPGDRPSPSASS